MSIGIGIVGLGSIAERVAVAVGNAPNTRLVAVRSRDASKAEAFAARHGDPVPYTEFDAFLRDPALEAVYIATPNAHHAEQAIAALGAGKHVLVEKPMALTVADAEAVTRAATDAELVLGIGFHLRFHPVHLRMRELIAGGRIGSPTFVEGMFGSMSDIAADKWQLSPNLAGHGSLTGLGVHLIDLLPWLLDDRISEVAAMSDGPGDRYPVEYLTSALLRFEGGAQGVLTCSRRLPNAENTVRVYGSEGLLEGVDTIGVNASGVLRETRDGATTVQEMPLEDLYTIEIGAFASAVEARASFAPGGEDGVSSVAVTSAIAEAASSRRTVKP